MPDPLVVDANEVNPTAASTAAGAWQTYVPERQRDIVRMFVTLGLLSSFVGIIFWACRESINSATQWSQTKDMLQIVLPAVSGLLGSVIGFYFGSSAGTDRRS